MGYGLRYARFLKKPKSKRFGNTAEDRPCEAVSFAKIARLKVASHRYVDCKVE